MYDDLTDLQLYFVYCAVMTKIIFRLPLLQINSLPEVIDGILAAPQISMLMREIEIRSDARTEGMQQRRRNRR